MTNQLEFIAEIGVNHEGSIEKAKELLVSLASSGGKVAKFQSYKAERLVTSEAQAYWDLSEESTTSQRELFQRYDRFDISDYFYLANFARALGLEFMSTCFDLETLHALDPILSRHKIASADITNYQLIDAISRKGKPILLSTGAATFGEIDEAVKLISKRTKDLTLLHCVLRYPTENASAALDRIVKLRLRYPGLRVGYSDHTVPTQFPRIQLTAWLLGASVIEKHFTLDKQLPGNDHYHAFDPSDLSNFVNQVSMIRESREFDEEVFIENQQSAREQARRGLYFSRNLKAGEIVKSEDLISLRPVGSFPSEDLFQVVGAKLKKGVLAFEQPSWINLG
jgi:N-acetylneuraminate synthase